MLEFLTKTRAIIDPNYTAGYLKMNPPGSSKRFSRRRDEWAPSRYVAWISALKKGDVVASPAEGVYGYNCDPFNDQAIQKICSLKNRPLGKGLVVLVRNERDVRRMVDFTGYEQEIENAMAKHWPGQVTLVLPVKKSISDYLTGGVGTVAVRMPSKPYMQEYLGKWGGPLVSTSLNLSGQPPARLNRDIPAGPVALKLESQRLDGSVSQIYNVLTGEWLR